MDLRDRLLPLASLLATPGRASGSEVRRACARVVEWAEREGKLGTALSWARVAATVDPQSAWMAYKVGTLARRRAEYHVAEVWLYHAIETGRRYRQWPAFIIAQISLGLLHAQRGDYHRAREILLRALHATSRPTKKANLRGQRSRLRDMRRRVLHDLMVVEMDTGRFVEAERYAREAYELMRPWHRRMPTLAHDTAYLWMQRGFFSRALPVFVAVSPHLHGDYERFLAYSHIARCAGAGEQAEVYRRATDNAQRILATLPVKDTSAAALGNFARGAAGIGFWDEATAWAERALEAARVRQEEDQIQALSSVLGQITAHRVIDCPSDRQTPQEAKESQVFASGLVESLEAMAAVSGT